MTAARPFLRLVVALLPLVVAAGCIRSVGISGDEPALPPVQGLVDAPAADTDHLPTPPPVTAAAEAEDAEAEDPATARTRPERLGTRPLEPGAPIPDTPAELVDRRLPPPPSALPPPPDETYWSRAGEVPPDVVARSTWHAGCPAPLHHLRYLTVTHWGFDGRVHTGELIVHKSATQGLIEVFRTLHEIRFPIEELRVISKADMEAEPTGDGNTSSAFVCRKKVSGLSWSEHSYGLALDLNPFHNPYLKGALIIPELSSAYLDRSHHRPGMIQPRDEVVRAFASMGWQWGGDWKTSKDWMHFSATGS